MENKVWNEWLIDGVWVELIIVGYQRQRCCYREWTPFHESKLSFHFVILARSSIDAPAKRKQTPWKQLTSLMRLSLFVKESLMSKLAGMEKQLIVLEWNGSAVEDGSAIITHHFSIMKPAILFMNKWVMPAAAASPPNHSLHFSLKEIPFGLVGFT